MALKTRCRSGSGDFLSLKRLAEVSRRSSLFRSTVRAITQRLKSLAPEHVRSVVSQQLTANIDAANQSQKWREKLKAELISRLLKRKPAQDAAPKARDAARVRAAILGDMHSIEHQQNGGKIITRQHSTHSEEQERVMRIFYAATNTDAVLERDAVSASVTLVANGAVHDAWS
jgi:hypothetical protein